MLDLKSEVKGHLKLAEPEAVAIDAGVSLEVVADWKKNAPMKAINWYVEKVLPRKGAKLDTSAPATWKQSELPHCQWEGRNLSILFPCYKETNAATMISMFAVALDLGKEKVRMDIECGDGVISNSRNKLAHRFLQTGAEWSLWIDSDMVPPIGRAAMTRYFTNAPKDTPDEVLNRHVVDRLMSHGKKLVGGLYFNRHEGGRACFAEAITSNAANAEALDPKSGLRETDWVATGCMLVHRSVYIDMQKRFPELAPYAGGTQLIPTIKWTAKDGTKSDTYTTGATAEVVAETSIIMPPRKEWDYFRMAGIDGEDVSFCKRAKLAGHQPYVDQGCRVAHIGYKSYCGSAPLLTSSWQ